MPQIILGEITIEVEQKDIKNVHLSVYPPEGAVRIAAPERMDMETIRMFAIQKLSWIKKQQAGFRKQERETPRDFLTRESHYFQGKRYLMRIIEEDKPPKIVLRHKHLDMYLRPNTPIEKRQEILDEWYRQELKSTLTPLVAQWESVIGVKCTGVGIRKMRTLWGSCNTEDKRIQINLELAKKPVECLEFIVVHELVHLLERNHNARFVAYMDEFLPKWRSLREELNRLPFRHVGWKY